MALYDSFIENMSAQPDYVQKLEIKRNERIAAAIHQVVERFSSAPPDGKRKCLEVGIGIGLFKNAISPLGYSYTALDRNQKMVDRVNAMNDGSVAVCASAPPVPAELKSASFDLAYAAFVAEHMADGLELFRFVEELKATLKTNGLLTLVCPDARSMGIEFWNQDYTHRYPTTERNVACSVSEAGFQIEKIIHYRGAMWTRFLYWLSGFVSCFYSYRWCGRLFGRPKFFYSVWQYLAIDTLLIICRKTDGSGA